MHAHSWLYSWGLVKLTTVLVFFLWGCFIMMNVFLEICLIFHPYSYNHYSRLLIKYTIILYWSYTLLKLPLQKPNVHFCQFKIGSNVTSMALVKASGPEPLSFNVPTPTTRKGANGKLVWGSHWFWSQLLFT